MRSGQKSNLYTSLDIQLAAQKMQTYSEAAMTELSIAQQWKQRYKKVTNACYCERIPQRG